MNVDAAETSREMTVEPAGDVARSVHGVFSTGERAESVSLPGFGVVVGELFAAGED